MSINEGPSPLIPGTDPDLDRVKGEGYQAWAAETSINNSLIPMIKKGILLHYSDLLPQLGITEAIVQESSSIQELAGWQKELKKLKEARSIK
ncbi:MAG: hypothetical protein M3Q81_05260 [bacterium]|nr:hypothetical protein [bacterium]